MSDKKRSKSKKGGKQSASSSSSSSASAQALSPLAQRLARCSRQTLEDALLETLGGVSGAEIDRILGEEVIQCPTSAALHVPSRSTFERVSPLPTRCCRSPRSLTNHTSAHASVHASAHDPLQVKRLKRSEVSSGATFSHEHATGAFDPINLESVSTAGGRGGIIVWRRAWEFTTSMFWN